MTKWHKFPEEIPETDKGFLVTEKLPNDGLTVGIAYFTIDQYESRCGKTVYQFLIGEFDDDITSSVTAWAEIPEPYIGKDDDDDEEAHCPHEP